MIYKILSFILILICMQASYAVTNWESSNDINNLSVNTLVSDPKDPSHLFAGTNNQGYWTSLDGKNWKAGNSQFYNKNILTILIDPNNSAHILLLVQINVLKLIYVSNNSGITWQVATLPVEGAIIADCIAVNPNNGSEVYAVSGREILKSIDGGRNWKVISKINLTDYSSLLQKIFINMNNPNEMFVTTLSKNNDLYKSTDGGITWKLISYSFRNDTSWGRDFKIYFIPNSTFIYLSCGNFLYISIDDGETWQIIYNFVATNVGISDLYIDQDNPAHILMSTERLTFDNTNMMVPSIQESVNGGFIWTPSNQNLETSSILALYGTKQYEYAATAKQGVFIR